MRGSQQSKPRPEQRKRSCVILTSRDPIISRRTRPESIGPIDTPRPRPRREDAGQYVRPCRSFGKDSRWAWAIVRGSTLLNPTAKLVYQVHLDLDRTDGRGVGGVWLSEAALAEQVGTDRSYAGDMRRLLVALGLLKQASAGYRRYRWFPTLPPGVVAELLEAGANNKQRAAWIRSAARRLDTVIATAIKAGGTVMHRAGYRDTAGDDTVIRQQAIPGISGYRQNASHGKLRELDGGETDSTTSEQYTRAVHENVVRSPAASRPERDTGSRDPEQERDTAAPEAPGGGPCISSPGGPPAPQAPTAGAPGAPAAPRVEELGSTQVETSDERWDRLRRIREDIQARTASAWGAA